MSDCIHNFIRKVDDKESYSSTCINNCGFKMSMKQWKELCFEDKLPKIKETA